MREARQWGPQLALNLKAEETMGLGSGFACCRGLSQLAEEVSGVLGEGAYRT